MTSVAPSAPRHDAPVRRSLIPSSTPETNSTSRSRVNGSGMGTETVEVGRKATALMRSNPGDVRRAVHPSARVQAANVTSGADFPDWSPTPDQNVVLVKLRAALPGRLTAMSVAGVLKCSVRTAEKWLSEACVWGEVEALPNRKGHVWRERRTGT